jgi:Ca-activated chloride channel family protein
MNRALRRLALAVAVLPAAVAAGDTPRELIEQGNAHYAAGRYAEALRSYEQAALGQAHPTPELVHDQAAARFKLGEIEDARDLWAGLKDVGDAAFGARTHYNLGNCDYADALTAVRTQDAQKALKLLAQAADQYRESLRLDPAMEDARANLELTQLLKRQIEEQAQNQPQSQPSQDQKQSEQQQQQPASKPAESQPGEQGQEQQPDQSRATQPSQTQPARPPESQESREGEEQREEQQQGERQPPPETMPAETRPAETRPAEPPAGAEELTGIELTREQAERLLQMIRDAEKARRERLMQQRAARQTPVERDW